MEKKKKKATSEIVFFFFYSYFTDWGALFTSNQQIQEDQCDHLPSPPELQLPEDRLRGREGGWDAGGVGGPPLRPTVPPLPRSRRAGGGGGRF